MLVAILSAVVLFELCLSVVLIKRTDDQKERLDKLEAKVSRFDNMIF